MVIFNSYVKLPEGKTPRSMEKGTMIFPKISSCQGYDSILQDSLYPIIQYWLGDYAIFHELGNYSNQIQPVFHRMTDSNAAQFSDNQVWWAQTPLPKISSQSISGRLKFCCETYFRGFTFFGYVLALSVVFRTRIHENPRDAAQLRMFDWFMWIFCGQCCQMAQHFANHMFAEHLKSSKKVQQLKWLPLEFPSGCTSYVAPL